MPESGIPTVLGLRFTKNQYIHKRNESSKLYKPEDCVFVRIIDWLCKYTVPEKGECKGLSTKVIYPAHSLLPLTATLGDWVEVGGGG